MTNNTAYEMRFYEVNYSPDGGKLIYVSRDSYVGNTGNNSIYMMDTTGANPQKVVDLTNKFNISNVKYNPGLTSDGKQVYFTQDKCLVACDLYGQNKRILVDNSSKVNIDIYYPCWSPDLKTIVFTSYNGYCYMLNADGSNIRELTINGQKFTLIRF